MTALKEFTPYTSYRLHYFPYEITRCLELKESTVSTRALYGNQDYRPPFPRLPAISPGGAPEHCSVCGSPFAESGPLQYWISPESGPLQYWISLWVATDVLPLLVHACSAACVGRLPPPAKRYVAEAQQGGLGIKQPERLYLL